MCRINKAIIFERYNLSISSFISYKHKRNFIQPLFWFSRLSKIYVPVWDYQAEWVFHYCMYRHNDALVSVLSERDLEVHKDYSEKFLSGLQAVFSPDFGPDTLFNIILLLWVIWLILFGLNHCYKFLKSSKPVVLP